MVLRKALEESPIGAAERPYGDDSGNRVVLIGNTQDVFIADAHGDFVREVTEEDKHRVVGHDDWKPIGRVLTTSGEVPKA